MKKGLVLYLLASMAYCHAMKVEDFKEAFGESNELFYALGQHESKELRPSETKFVGLLLSDKRNEPFIESFFAIALPYLSDPKNSWAPRIVRTAEEAWASKGNVFRESEEVKQVVFGFLREAARIKEEVRAKDIAAYPAGFAFDRFPEEECSFADFREQKELFLQDRGKRGAALFEEMRRRAVADPAMQISFKETLEYTGGPKAVEQPPYDYNRTGKELGIYVNATNITMQDGQRFIIAGLPHDKQCAANYISGAMAQGSAVFVSLHESDDTADRLNGFWKAEATSDMRFYDGSFVVKTDEKVLYHGKPGINRDTKVVETTITLSNGKELTHLHYEGWCDSTPVPDIDLFQKMLARMRELNVLDAPIAINCKGGVGRSGFTLLVYALERSIDKMDSLGNINLIEIIYALRKQRANFFGTEGLSLARLYEVLDNYISGVE